MYTGLPRNVRDVPACAFPILPVHAIDRTSDFPRSKSHERLRHSHRLSAEQMWSCPTEGFLDQKSRLPQGDCIRDRCKETSSTTGNSNNEILEMNPAPRLVGADPVGVCALNSIREDG